MPVKTEPTKEKKTRQEPEISEPWNVVLFNDEIHSFDEVILQVQKATACSILQATQITIEAHIKGKALAFAGEFEACFSVSGVLKEIGLLVEIQG